MDLIVKLSLSCKECLIRKYFLLYLFGLFVLSMNKKENGLILVNNYAPTCHYPNLEAFLTITLQFFVGLTYWCDRFVCLKQVVSVLRGSQNIAPRPGSSCVIQEQGLEPLNRYKKVVNVSLSRSSQNVLSIILLKPNMKGILDLYGTLLLGSVNYFGFFFSVRLLSVLCGHSVFSSPSQRPMTSDFEGFLYQILSITLFSYLNS